MYMSFCAGKKGRMAESEIDKDVDVPAGCASERVRERFMLKQREARGVEEKKKKKKIVRHVEESDWFGLVVDQLAFFGNLWDLTIEHDLTPKRKMSSFHPTNFLIFILSKRKNNYSIFLI